MHNDRARRQDVLLLAAGFLEADVLGNALGPLLHLLLVPAGYVQAQLGGRVCNRDQQVLAVWSA